MHKKTGFLYLDIWLFRRAEQTINVVSEQSIQATQDPIKQMLRKQAVCVCVLRGRGRWRKIYQLLVSGSETFV